MYPMLLQHCLLHQIVVASRHKCTDLLQGDLRSFDDIDKIFSSTKWVCSHIYTHLKTEMITLRALMCKEAA